MAVKRIPLRVHEQVEAKSSLSEAFALENSAVIDANSGTIRIPISGAARFFRLRHATNKPAITSVRRVGSNLEISFGLTQ